MSSIANVPGLSSLSGADLRALAKAASEIGVPADWLATIISFESAGSFSPSKLNAAGSGAFGLIQFLPSTAANLLGGTQADAAARGKAMSFAEQLEEMVVPYFNSFHTNFHSLEDLYLAVFYPAAMNKAPLYVVGASPSKVYTQNAGLDKEGKGYITKTDVTSAIVRHAARADGRISIGPSLSFLLVGVVVAFAGLYTVQPLLPKDVRLPESVVSPIRKALAMAQRKGKAWVALLPLAVLGVVSFGWVVLKGKA